MITQFTLFHVTYVNPQTMDLVYKGLMRKRDVVKFLEHADANGLATCIELSREHLKNGNIDYSG